MNTVPLACGGGSLSLADNVANKHCAADMDDSVESESYVCDPALRAEPALVDRREDDRESGLAKSTPGIFQDISLEEYALGIL